MRRGGAPAHCAECRLHGPGHRHYSAQAHDLRWRCGVRRGPVSELARIVVAPRTDGPVASDGKTEVETSPYRDHPVQARDLHRRRAVQRSPVAELAVEVEAPCPDASVVLGQETVVAS